MSRSLLLYTSAVPRCLRKANHTNRCLTVNEFSYVTTHCTPLLTFSFYLKDYFANGQIFRYIRKIAESDCGLRDVCPSAGNNSAPIGRICTKFDI